MEVQGDVVVQGHVSVVVQGHAAVVAQDQLGAAFYPFPESGTQGYARHRGDGAAPRGGLHAPGAPDG